MLLDIAFIIWTRILWDHYKTVQKKWKFKQDSFLYFPRRFSLNCPFFVTSKVQQNRGCWVDQNLRLRYVHMCLYTFMHTYVYKCMYVYMSICILCVCVCAYLYVYAYIYIYMYIHMHLYVYVNICIYILGSLRSGPFPKDEYSPSWVWWEGVRIIWRAIWGQVRGIADHWKLVLFSTFSGSLQ